MKQNIIKEEWQLETIVGVFNGMPTSGDYSMSKNSRDTI